MSLHPNRTLIPSVEEFARLSRSAGMAFATRCVRWVVPIYHTSRGRPHLSSISTQWNAPYGLSRPNARTSNGPRPRSPQPRDAAARASSGPAWAAARLVLCYASNDG